MNTDIIAPELGDDDIVTALERGITEAGAQLDLSNILQTNYQTSCHSLEELLAFVPDEDPNRLIGSRYLCKGGSLLINGPTGIGKSSLTVQMAISFCLGEPIFGLTPVREMTVSIVQAENDEGDLAEMIQGVVGGLQLRDEDKAQLGQRLHFHTNTTNAYDKFVEMIYAIYDKDQPDFIIADPLFSYIGEDLSTQGPVSHFLRQGVGPFLHDTGCAVIFVHHIKKPRKDDDGSSSYSAYGSVELSNWPRAVISIEPAKGGIFKMVFAKRGNRADVARDPGAGTPVKYIKHSDRGIFWEETEKPDDGDRSSGGGNRPGAYTRNYPTEDMLAHYDPGLDWTENKRRIGDALGCSVSTVDRRKSEILAMYAESPSEQAVSTVDHGQITEDSR